jgi:phosphatidylglycerophosphatase A
VSYRAVAVSRQPLVARSTHVDDHPAVEWTKRQRTVILIGSLGPFGFLPASGTVTVAVLGVPLFYLMREWPYGARLLVALVITGLAVWIHQLGDRILGEKDSRKLVWDEIAGFLIAIAILPFTPTMALVALVIERVLDILKVPPASWIERTWPGGWGVVGDDVVAGLYTCAVLRTAMLIAPSLLGLSP